MAQGNFNAVTYKVNCSDEIINSTPLESSQEYSFGINAVQDISEVYSDRTLNAVFVSGDVDTIQSNVSKYHSSKCINWTEPADGLNDANSSSNATNAGSFYNFYETEQFAVLWLLLLSIVIGNTAVIVALRLSKARKSRTNFFIMHLALADLLVGLISVLTDLVWKITIFWYAGNVACKVVRFAQILVTYSSTYVLVALSIDRYDAITHPMNFSGSWQRARRLVVAAWAVSALFASPSLYLFNEAIVKGVTQCWIDFDEAWQWQVYMVIVSITLFIVPCLLISTCYVIIVYTIWSKSKMMMGSVRQKPTSSAAAAVVAPVILTANSEKGRVTTVLDEDSRRASSRGLIPKAKIKTVKMTLVIVLVFILCWSPYIVFDLLQVFGHAPNNQALATFMQSLAPLNSAANPIIYCLFSTRLCRNLRRLRAVDWLARHACPWCSCLQEPLDDPFRRRTTEYTTMTDSRRPNTTSVRYHGSRYHPARSLNSGSYSTTAFQRGTQASCFSTTVFHKTTTAGNYSTNVLHRATTAGNHHFLHPRRRSSLELTSFERRGENSYLPSADGCNRRRDDYFEDEINSDCSPVMSSMV